MKLNAVLAIAALIWVILLMKAKQNPLSGVTQGRISQLSTAIAGIEGGSPTNPGNIKNSLGQIAENADLDAKLNFDFVLGLSHLYSPDMTFTQFAWMYVAGTTPGDWAKVAPGDNPDNWASYVAGSLNVDVNSTVGAFLQS